MQLLRGGHAAAVGALQQPQGRLGIVSTDLGGLINPSWRSSVLLHCGIANMGNV